MSNVTTEKERIQQGMQAIRDEIRDLQAIHEKLGRLKERTLIISNLAEAMNKQIDNHSVEERTRQAVYMHIIAELTEGGVR